MESSIQPDLKTGWKHCENIYGFDFFLQFLPKKMYGKILLFYYGPLFLQLLLYRVQIFWTDSSMKFNLRFFISKKMKKLKAGDDCHLAQLNIKSFIQIQISPAFLQAYNKF